MDKYNIIEPKDNLVDLDIEMNQWYSLPIDIQMLSNDECIRQHNCTVVDYYNKIKLAIINNISDDSNGNIVRESNYIIYDNPEDYNYRIALANNLMKSPYIVMITPDIKTMEELETRYNSYKLLSSRNKVLSDDYSWQLFGFNVMNMYDVVRIDISNDSDDIESKGQRNTITAIENYSSIAESYYDIINHSMISFNFLDKIKAAETKNKLSIYEGTNISNIMVNSIVNDRFGNILDKEDLSLVVPKVVPWFTESEMIKNNYNCSIVDNTSYYREVMGILDYYSENKDEESEQKLLSLGWNPSVPLTEESIDYARKRQCNEISKLECINVSNFSSGIDNACDNKNANLIFFVIKDEKTYISFSSNLDILYEFVGYNDSFTGFKKRLKTELLYNDSDIEVSMIYVDNNVFEKIKEKAVSLENNDRPLHFNSIYSILNKARNEYDINKKRVIYSNYIYTLLRIAFLDDDNDSGYTVANYKSVYIVYNGKLSGYDSKSIDNIISILADKSNICEFLKQSGVSESVANIRCNDLSLAPVIYHTK